MGCFDSILFTHPCGDPELVKPPDCLADLHLDQIIDAIVWGYGDDGFKDYFYVPVHDLGAVRYRHEVFGDLACDAIRGPIQTFVTDMAAMYRNLERAQTSRHRLQRQRWFLDGVRAYCDALAALRRTLSWADVSSQGLSRFAEYLADYVDGRQFGALVAETDTVQTALAKVRYTTHIDGLRVRVGRYTGESNFSTDVAGVFDRFRGEAGADYARPFQSEYMNHVETMILERVAKLHPAAFAMLSEYCERNQSFVDPTIATFKREIGFYLAYLKFMSRLAPQGVVFSYPTVSTTCGAVYAEDAFDLALATKRLRRRGSPLVCNDFGLAQAERIVVVTGPNQGGKTTFARTIGQLIYLAALGCPVPAARASVMLPDQIFTHFERRESLATLHGKLESELVSIRDILARATDRSVIVMNESFSSTTVDDSLLIATEVLRRIIAVGCVAVFVTFLDELASLDPACISMVGDVAPDDPTRRTYHFTRRRADGRAYATALADKYGLSREKLTQRMIR